MSPTNNSLAFADEKDLAIEEASASYMPELSLILTKRAFQNVEASHSEEVFFIRGSLSVSF